MNAQIFSIGTEILLGNIVDTNSQFIAQKLVEYGIDLFKMETIGDNADRLYRAFKECDGKVDYVITSGGLGPTPDDISKEVAIKVCDLQDELELDKKSYQALIDYFNGNEESAMSNIKQAKFPKSAIILENTLGTAPGCILTSKKGTKYILMPGPPNEMKHMFESEVAKHISKNAILKSKTVKIGLLGEWDMARRIDLDRTEPTISPYITDEGPILRITAKADNEKEVDRQLDIGLEIVNASLTPYVITTEDVRKEKVLIDLLEERNEKVSTAESITGGLISASIIDIPGASNVISESYVTYSNEVKEKVLGVSRETIKEYSVVSEEVLSEMLVGLYNKTNSNLCIATTGYAHTGEVWIGVLYNGMKYTKLLQLNGDRNRVRLRTKIKVIDTAILVMRGEYENNIGI
ncbi:CinA family nicotinamide mononucleotide deamidase-related protein [Anaerococcus sp.]|uniref:CinA family nicotinamide mononucleotide deamidase-related protein n=1 Tax=Anaerococcus sp. TaxID=1872515 RepID=UPI00257DC651|nr:CinA family nicotinamide mononucleotide deamidase-related protein [Anaerococcus sp.]MBS6105208.1 CinA family nicotinamide mononucleotide deamidase-related protein [Anaerococcus sp.]